MAQITLSIDGQEVHAEKGASLLETARHVGIKIPHLCYHEDLMPYGGCRLCMVEISRNGRSRLVASCAYEVEEGLEVKTMSERVVRVRSHLIEVLLSTAPFMREVQELAKEYGVRETRFTAGTSYCILCGLCVRYCDEVKGDHAVGFIGRGTDRRIAWLPDAAYDKFCRNCQECMDFCPTGVFPSNVGMDTENQLRSIETDFPKSSGS